MRFLLPPPPPSLPGAAEGGSPRPGQAPRLGGGTGETNQAPPFRTRLPVQGQGCVNCCTKAPFSSWRTGFAAFCTIPHSCSDPRGAKRARPSPRGAATEPGPCCGPIPRAAPGGRTAAQRGQRQRSARCRPVPQSRRSPGTARLAPPLLPLFAYCPPSWNFIGGDGLGRLR